MPDNTGLTFHNFPGLCRCKPGKERTYFTEDRLAVISCIISNPESTAAVNEKLHLQSELIIARLGVPCRKYGVSVISVVMHGTQNQISTFAGDLGKVEVVKVKSIQVPVTA